MKKLDNLSNAERATAHAEEAEKLLRDADGSGEAYRAKAIRGTGHATLALYYRDLADTRTKTGAAR